MCGKPTKSTPSASLYAAARKLIAVELVNGGESNPWYDAATIVNVPWLMPAVVAA